MMLVNIITTETFECLYQGHQLGIKNLLTVFENLNITKHAKGMSQEDIYKHLERVGLSNVNEFCFKYICWTKKENSHGQVASKRVQDLFY